MDKESIKRVISLIEDIENRNKNKIAELNRAYKSLFKEYKESTDKLNKQNQINNKRIVKLERLLSQKTHDINHMEHEINQLKSSIKSTR